MYCVPPKLHKHGESVTINFQKNPKNQRTFRCCRVNFVNNLFYDPKFWSGVESFCEFSWEAMKLLQDFDDFD